ncbi:hypothetical protein [Ancylomarina longa]|uniref:Curli assembly protein CsgC n=1 Tax=Ancylomarina longa TaxID=2487017 RepID=A0A434AZH7_9BACT|nr:hypothetical protein [Ancylomarina longa]RUT80032.1 hypothetical protein DLK05_01360 [Ancylomarina longa]
MIIKHLIILYSFLLIGVSQTNLLDGKQIKAWIEMEGEVSNLTLTAKLQNLGSKLINLDYILKTEKNGRSGHSSTIQKGKVISEKLTILSLSESRVNLLRNDNLIVSLKVYHNNLLIAQDSVVLHGDNH